MTMWPNHCCSCCVKTGAESEVRTVRVRSQRTAISIHVCHTGLKTALEQDLFLLESCLQTCMTYTIAECTVNKLLMTGRGTLENT